MQKNKFPKGVLDGTTTQKFTTIQERSLKKHQVHHGKNKDTKIR